MVLELLGQNVRKAPQPCPCCMLHTNSAIETITRLLEMGIEPFLVASSVDLIIAQRLMRKICPDCIREIANPNKHLDYLKKNGSRGFRI